MKKHLRLTKLKTAKAKVTFIQEIKKAVGEQKELTQEHFKSALENWFAAPHSTKEPYQLTVSERKNIAEKVYPEGTLISLGDVLTEYEKVFTDPEMFTYDPLCGFSLLLNIWSKQSR